MVSSLYSPADESKEIWVYLEQKDGILEHVSLELLSQGRLLADKMNWRLVGLIMGGQVDSLTQEAFVYGADCVWLAEHSLLKHFTVDAYTRVAFQTLTQGKPSIFLLGATHNGRDLAARLAVRLRTGLNADCTNLRIDPLDGLMISEVSGFGGGVLALIGMRNYRPQMATVRPGVFPVGEAKAGRTGEVVQIKAELSEEMIRTCIVQRNVGGGIDLTQTQALVAGGRGAGNDFADLKKLASLLGGDLGVTRPLVDMGLAERERQIGQTGTVCSPKLAICCGVSGAFHFVVGIEKSGTVIAINSDPEAPIFDFSDYCVVGDARKVVPALIEALSGMTETSHE